MDIEKIKSNLQLLKVAEVQNLLVKLTHSNGSEVMFEHTADDCWAVGVDLSTNLWFDEYTTELREMAVAKTITMFVEFGFDIALTKD